MLPVKASIGEMISVNAVRGGNLSVASIAMALAMLLSSCALKNAASPDAAPCKAAGSTYKDDVWGNGTRIPSVFPNNTPPRPDWIHKLDCVYQLRIDKFAEPKDGESSIAAATKRLDYLADLGVNCILLNPVAKRNGKTAPAFFNFYGVSDNENLDPYLGTPDEFKLFVQRAHELGILVLLDVVPHGVVFGSPMLTDHPDWFKKDKDGKIIGTWGMADFDWTQPKAREWWIDTMCDKWALKYDLDGFRCDCEPAVSGYDLWDKVRLRCEAAGRPVLIMSEGGSPERKMAYHIGQMDYCGSYSFLALDVADEVKRLEQAYYAVEISSHDYLTFTSEGKPVSFVALLSPFIPLWRMGDEFNSKIVYATGRTPDAFVMAMTWGIYNSVGEQAVKGQLRKLGRNGCLAQDFSVRGTTEVSVHVKASGKLPTNKLRLTLFHSAPSYKIEDTSKGQPVAQETFTGFGGDEWLTLKLNKLVYGHFLLKLDEAEGDISVFGAEGSNYGGSFFTSASGAGEKDFDMDLKATTLSGKYGECLYFAPIDWASLEDPAKAALHERIKRILAVRKAYDYILSPFSARMKDRNVVKVDAAGTKLQTYACFRGNQALVVVGNNSPSAIKASLRVPLKEMGLAGFSSYKSVSLLVDSNPVAEGDVSHLEVALRPWEVEAILIEGIDGWNRLYGKAPDAGELAKAGSPLGQEFTADAPFDKLRIKAFGDADASGLKVSIYATEAQEGGAPLVTCDFPAFADSDWLELDFQPLPAGNYRWTAEAMGSGQLGVWRTDGDGRRPLRSFVGNKPLPAGNYIAEWR